MADCAISSALQARSVRHAVYAASIILAPIAVLGGSRLNPAIGGIGAGAANVAANVAADPATNQLHVALYAVDTFLLPLSVLGLAGLALERSPWLATIGGGLGLIGWLPWSALVAQDDVTFQIGRLGGDPGFVELWNRFTTDAVMGGLTLLYVIGHLVAYILLGIALGRARIIPLWAAWALVLTTPITIAAFALRAHVLLDVVAVFWLAGSVPAAFAVWRDRDRTAPHIGAGGVQLLPGPGVSGAQRSSDSPDPLAQEHPTLLG
jgi:hypothetical protein